MQYATHTVLFVCYHKVFMAFVVVFLYSCTLLRHNHIDMGRCLYSPSAVWFNEWRPSHDRRYKLQRRSWTSRHITLSKPTRHSTLEAFERRQHSLYIQWGTA